MPIKITTANVRLRSTPRISAANIVRRLNTGERVNTLGETCFHSGYEWIATVIPETSELGWVASAYLRDEVQPPPPPPPPPPPRRRNTFGLHYYPYDTEPSALFRLAETGLLQGVTVVNEVGIANQLVRLGVPYVVLRVGVGDSDPKPTLTGTDDDIRTGRDWFYQPRLWDGGRQADERVILQVGNEWLFDDTLQAYDALFWKGVIAAADAEKRRVVIFNDYVGNPHMWTVGSQLVSDIWVKRRPALVACLYDANGTPRLENRQHFIGYHAYGRYVKDVGGSFKASDAEAWSWFSGRWAWVFGPDGIYPDLKPPLLYNEYGPYDIDTRKMPNGLEDIIADVRASLPQIAPNDQVKAFMYWTLGIWKGNPGIDPAIPAFERIVREYLNS